MLSMDEAMKKARRLAKPAPGVVVKGKIEVMCAYMKLHGLRKFEWRGELLVLTPLSLSTATSPQMKEHLGGEVK